jgi:hypothetical protein
VDLASLVHMNTPCMTIAYTGVDNLDLHFPDTILNWDWEQNHAGYQFFPEEHEVSASDSDENRRSSGILASGIRDDDSAMNEIYFAGDMVPESALVATQCLGVSGFRHDIAGALSTLDTGIAMANQFYLDRGLVKDISPESGKLQRQHVSPSVAPRDETTIPRASNNRSLCPYPGCIKSFGRKYEAKRHYNSIHASVAKFQCTYPHCSRVAGFVRKDKWMVHERIHYKLEGRYGSQYQ